MSTETGQLHMLDFGLHRLEMVMLGDLKFIYQPPKNLEDFVVLATYNSKENKIDLTTTAFLSVRTQGYSDVATACSLLLKIIRYQINVPVSAGGFVDSSSWISFFHHAGWSEDNLAEDKLSHSLPMLLRLGANIYDGNQQVSCRSMYLSDIIDTSQVKPYDVSLPKPGPAAN